MTLSFGLNGDDVISGLYKILIGNRIRALTIFSVTKWRFNRWCNFWKKTVMVNPRWINFSRNWYALELGSESTSVYCAKLYDNNNNNRNFYSDICCAAKPRCSRATVTIGDKKTDRKWCVLSLRLNVETVSQEVRSVGRLFQILGPTNENARRPKEVWTRLGTVSCRWLDDRNWRAACRGVRIRCKYEGVLVQPTLYTSSASLYSIRCRTGNQWSGSSNDNGSVCARRLTDITARAAEFWTRCNLLMVDTGAP